MSVLAPALGLEQGASAEDAKGALERLVARAKSSELGVAANDALNLISRATTPEAGFLDLYEVRPVVFGNSLRTVSDVEQAIRVVRQALDITSVGLRSSVAPIATGHNEAVGIQFTMPHAPDVRTVGDILHQSIGRVRDTRVLAFEKAMQYLHEHWIVEPQATEDRSPSPETTQLLKQHGMVWKWNSATVSWDPRLNTPRNQSLFSAAPEYLRYTLDKGSPERKNLVQSLLRARQVEDAPSYRARRPQHEKILIGDLLQSAEALLGEEVSLARVMRLQALYRFLTATAQASVS